MFEREKRVLARHYLDEGDEKGGGCPPRRDRQADVVQLDCERTAFVGDPTFGDAILDRLLLNNAHRITLKGGSMRRLCDSTKETPATTPNHT